MSNIPTSNIKPLTSNFQRTTSNSAITLIALIITIIVLLILAGVTLNMVMGGSGIFQKANQAKEQTKLSNAEEIIRLAVLENKVKSVSGDADALTNEELKTEIGKKLIKQGYTVSGSTVTYYGDKTIDIDNYLNEEKTTTMYTAYNVGEKVIVGGENFYVIKTSNSSEEKVILLAEKNIDTTTLKQSDGTNATAFSSTNYWSGEMEYPLDLNNYSLVSVTETDAISKAKAYGKAKGGKGRVMTVEEVVALGGDKNSNSSEECPAWLNSTSFWLGSAYDYKAVWSVYGGGAKLQSGGYGYNVGYGVRPVIEISKILIENS